MSAAGILLGHPLAERAGWILWHSLWQGAVIAAGFALLRVALRRFSPEVRYLAGCLAMALLVAAPVATVVLGVMPSSQFGDRFSGTGIVLPLSRPAPQANASAASDVGGPPLFQWLADYCGQLAPVLTLVWLVGVAVGSMRLARGWWCLRTLRYRHNEPVDPAWLETLADLRCRLEISRPVRLLQSALVDVPTVIGWLRPIILLPAATLAGLTPGQLEAILAHELAHVRRWDYLVNATQCLIETLMFYHPATWWISKCIREERENCCDDLVVKICGNCLAYARALATLEESRARLPEFAFAASGGSLLSRIRRLLGPADKTGPALARKVAGLSLLMIGLLMILAGLYLVLAPARYWAVSRIKVENPRVLDGAAQAAPYDPYFIQTEFEILQSEPVLRTVVEGLDLVKRWAKRPAQSAPLTLFDAIGQLRARIQFRPIRNTPLVEISAFSSQPKEAAAIANALADAYRDYRREQRQQLSRGGIKALEESWKHQEAKIGAAQKKVDELRKELNVPDAVSDGDMRMSAETLRKLEELRIERRAEYVGLETLLSRLKKMNPEQLREAIPTAWQDALLNSLLEKLSLARQRLVLVTNEFGPSHVEVVKAHAQVADLSAHIDSRITGILLGLDARVNSLKESLTDLENEVAREKTSDIEFAKTSRPYFDAKRNLEELQHFRQLLTMKIAAESIDSQLPNGSFVEIIDRATSPLRAAAPNRYLGAALILLGLLLDFAGLRTLNGKIQP